METILNLTYASSLTDICERNSSFDSGVLRIAYYGQNKNKTSISKQVFEKCIRSIYNCPVVCHYDRETDTLGGHDQEIGRDANGNLRLYNLTEPVGCIPESANVWWDSVTEEDGTEHEYLYTDVLLWKRQTAYQKIKENGVTAHSMEITVKDGELVDGIFEIYDFEFTAFTLIGVEPCFESSALKTFSKKEFKLQLQEMMDELKATMNQVDTSSEVHNTHPQEIYTEGGTEPLEEKNDTTGEIVTERVPEQSVEQTYALTEQLVTEIIRELEAVKINYDWGECPRYFYTDCDFEENEVYFWDRMDWLLYGCKFTVDGDAIKIDFESKRRKKYTITDFDEGENADQRDPFSEVFALMQTKLEENKTVEENYRKLQESYSNAENELNDLRSFKENTEKDKADAERKAVYEKFEDLAGNEEFESLRKNDSDMSAEVVREKCYAIRGKYGVAVSYSKHTDMPKLVVDKNKEVHVVYGGLFEKYGNE